MTYLLCLHQTKSNIMKQYLLLVLLAFNFNSFAQDYKPCGTDEMVQKALEEEPSLRIYRQMLIDQMDSLKADSQKSYTQDLHVIPVVVHVMHTGGSNNISDAQIHDAMRIINEDFNKLNSDTSSVRAEFQDIIGNIGVEFELAKLDPDGNCTKGITRTYTELTSSAGENVKALIGWDPRMYLNIWVVSSIASGAGGYSFYPGSAPNNDANAGIVILKSQFGSIGAANGGNFSSRSLTHEIGHYLNLPHTWGSTNENYQEENCNSDDGIEDTPNTIGSNLGCNLNQNTCGSLDNVQNFMDYSSCAKMYTEGQKSVMRWTLESGYIWSLAARSNLWTEENLELTGLNEGYEANDCLALIDFGSDRKIACIGDEVLWEDFSYNYDSALSWNWDFPGTATVMSNEQNPSISYTTTGYHDATLSITTTGGTSTKTIENAIYIQDNSISLMAPTVQNFETSTFPLYEQNPEWNWFIQNVADGETWAWNNNASSDGTASVRIRSYNFESPGTRQLISPVYNLSNLSAPCYLYFDYAHARRNMESDDSFKVKVTDNCGQSWQNRMSKTTETLITTNANSYFDYVPNANDWEEQKVSISPWAGEDNVQFLFEFEGSGGNYLYIDNLRVGGELGMDELINSEELNFNVFPNPNEGNAQINITLFEESDIEIQVIDLLGKSLGTLQSTLSPGEQNIALKDIQKGIPKGTYFIKLNIGTYQETQLIIIY